MEWQIKDKLILLTGSVGVAVGIVLIFKYLFYLVAPFVLGFLLAKMLERPVKWLTKKVRGHKTLVTIVLTSLVGIAVGAVVIFLGIKVCEEVKNFLAHFDYYRTMLFCKLDGICCYFDQWFGMEQGRSIGMLSQNVDNFINSMQKDMVTSVINVSIPVIGALVGFFAAITVLFISAVFLGKDLDRLRAWKEKNIFSREVSLLWNAMKRLGNAYFKVQGIIILLNSAICGLGLLILKNPYWLVLGLIIGILDALPVFGTGTVFIPWSIICLISGQVGRAAFLYSLYLVTYFLREILESKMMGSRLGVAPLTMLFAIYVGVLVYGFWGFILGPVSYCIIKELILYLKNLLECGKVNSI